MTYKNPYTKITQRRNGRHIRGVMSVKVNSNDTTIKLNLIFPTLHYNKNLGAANPINEDTKLFAKSIATEILKILKSYKFEIKEGS